MGSNDHVPVPDPQHFQLHELPGGKTSQPLSTPETPKVQVPRPSRESAQREVARSYTNRPKAPELIGGPTTTNERLDSLEKSQERNKAQAVSVLTSLVNLSNAIVDLQRLLRQTARGVDRLAQGKSRGNLGLPSDEDWKSYDTTL